MDRTLARRVLGATEKTYEPAYFIAIDPDVARDSCSRMNAGQMLAKYGVESNLCQLCHGKPGHNPTIPYPGKIIMLTTEVRLPPDVHVYAPGTKGYKPINVLMDPIRDAHLKSAAYPRSKILYLPAIKERVPVFEGTFRIRQDVQVPTASDFSNSLGADGKTITIAGKLEYQACDSKICFLPSSVPVHWQLQILPLDRQRAPENIQHK